MSAIENAKLLEEALGVSKVAGDFSSTKRDDERALRDCLGSLFVSARHKLIRDLFVARVLSLIFPSM